MCEQCDNKSVITKIINMNISQDHITQRYTRSHHKIAHNIDKIRFIQAIIRFLQSYHKSFENHVHTINPYINIVLQDKSK
jgi:hypothetical protein